jgi:hypothetical protein
MSIHFTFNLFTNLIGLNFFERVLCLDFVITFNFILTILFFILSLASTINNNEPSYKPVFVFIDFIQLWLPLILKVFSNFQAIVLRKKDEKLIKKTQLIYDEKIVQNRQIKYFIFVAFSITLEFFKATFQTHWTGVMYILAYSSNILVASNDFFYVYHILCLRDYMKQMNTKQSQSLSKSILNVIEIQSLIHERFSSNLLLSMSLYFMLSIFSLFWIFLRIVYGLLHKLRGNINR